MADRYLRATGNWNGSVWAATSGGAAGSAATPTADDYVYIAANFTVTLTANAECLMLQHTNGTLDLGSYKLSKFHDFWSNGTTARTINLGSGILETDNLYGGFGEGIHLSGSNLTLNAGTSQVVINVEDADFDSDTLAEFNTNSLMFNDVLINLGAGGSFRAGINITGSPTFRNLIIQSKNSAAHTVNFDEQSIDIDKFIAVGSSSSNRLAFTTDNAIYTALNIQEGGTSYGQYLDFDTNVINEYKGSSGWVSAYIGSNSVDDSGTWITQNLLHQLQSLSY